jgi:hypothetical protein
VGERGNNGGEEQHEDLAPKARGRRAARPPRLPNFDEDGRRLCRGRGGAGRTERGGSHSHRGIGELARMGTGKVDYCIFRGTFISKCLKKKISIFRGTKCNCL